MNRFVIHPVLVGAALLVQAMTSCASTPQHEAERAERAEQASYREPEHVHVQRPAGFRVFEVASSSESELRRATTAIPISASASSELVDCLRPTGAFTDVQEALDPTALLLSENQIHITGPIDVTTAPVDLSRRLVPDAEAYESAPVVEIEATFLAHTGLRTEPIRWTAVRRWVVTAQGNAVPHSIREAIADRCRTGWEAACALSLFEPNALADQLTAALATRGSTEQVTARIDYLRARSNELRKVASEQKTRAYELDRQIGDLESRDAVAQGLSSTTSALSGLSNDPLSGLHAAGAQIRLDAARAKNQQNRDSLRRAADDARQLADKYETLATRADGMVAPLLELMYSTSGN